MRPQEMEEIRHKREDHALGEQGRGAHGKVRIGVSRIRFTGGRLLTRNNMGDLRCYDRRAIWKG